jgi:hypothetical protein
MAATQLAKFPGFKGVSMYAAIGIIPVKIPDGIGQLVCFTLIPFFGES